MKNRRIKATMPFVLVQVPQDQYGILKITRCCNLVVRTKLQRAKTEPSQCHRCQRFGHAQSRCTAAVKCKGEHHSADCTKSRETSLRRVQIMEDPTPSYIRAALALLRKSPPRRRQRRNQPQTRPRLSTRSPLGRPRREAMLTHRSRSKFPPPPPGGLQISNRKSRRMHLPISSAR